MYISHKITIPFIPSCPLNPIEPRNPGSPLGPCGPFLAAVPLSTHSSAIVRRSCFISLQYVGMLLVPTFVGVLYNTPRINTVYRKVVNKVMKGLNWKK